jgi:hypothetical protein
MTTPPTFSSGQILTSSAMNSVGLWLVKTQTIGTGVSDVTVTDAFSSDFDNYRITVSGFTGSAGGAAMTIQCVTTAGVVNASNWIGNTFYVSSGVAGALTNANITNAGSCEVGYGSTAISSIMFDILGPQAARPTNIRFNDCDNSFWRVGAFFLNNTTSFTRIKFALNTGTITGGTIRIYGMRN